MERSMTGKDRKRTYTADVVSNRMDKTVVVAVKKTFRHPVYKKVIRRTAQFKAHDEKNECRIGDRVLIRETRPISRDKHWRVIEVIKRSELPADETESTPAESR
jgi:small subunit ribosomal protein S17